MSTFDQILPIISDILRSQTGNIEKLGSLIINRDLNGRIRLIVDERISENNELRVTIETIALAFEERLGPHTFTADHIVFFESSINDVVQGSPHFILEGFNNVIVVDRLATDTDWAKISPISSGAPRVVFFSI